MISSGTTKAAASKLLHVASQGPSILLSAVRAAVAMIVRTTVKDTLENRGPRYLNRRTGTLIRSVTASPRVEPARIEASRFGTVVRGAWGTSLGYGRRHEFGGTFTDKVRPHVRRLKGSSRRSADDAFAALHAASSPSRKIGTSRLKAMARGLGVAYVRAHSRTTTYRARRMFRDSLKNAAPQLRSVINDALRQGLEGGSING